MVTTGFSKPYVAKYSNTTGTTSYTGGMSLGRGVSFSLEPEVAEDNDYYTQAGDLYRLLSAEEKERLCQNIKEAMEGVDVKIKKLQIEHFKKADPAYGKRVEELVL